jgi:hypothetical protein
MVDVIGILPVSIWHTMTWNNAGKGLKTLRFSILLIGAIALPTPGDRERS